MEEKIYKLTYYAELAQVDGGLVRVEFYAKYERAQRITPKEIGDVIQGLYLEMQGQSEDIDAPIVKTALIMSVVDAPEMNTDKFKCGDWEQFYTSDATGWKVVLLGKSKGEEGFRTLWGGYVTPDSYTETLQHHGVITITARDNIGLLQDMKFDGYGNADGMITPYALVNQAWEKIASPMNLEWRGEEDENIWLQSGGADIIDAYLNLSAFADMTWYDAVHEVLASLGLTLRYVGNNSVAVASLRRLPYQAAAYMDNMPQTVPQFMAYGTRELMPAAKSIEEIVTYDLTDGKEVPGLKGEDFDGTTLQYDVMVPDDLGNLSPKSIMVMPIKNETLSGWGNRKDETLFFNPTLFRNPQHLPLDGQTFFAMAISSAVRTVWYSQPVYAYDMKMIIERATLLQLKNSVIGPVNYVDAYSITGYITLVQDEVEYYYDGEGEWVQTAKELTFTFENGVINCDIVVPDYLQGYGVITLWISKVAPEWSAGDYTQNGPYVGLKVSFVKLDTQAVVEENKVTTVYDEKNNVLITRRPTFGPVFNTVALSEFIRNGIFLKEDDIYLPTADWRWPYESDVMQLAAQIHRQLLCYHSKPNNLLSGTLVGTDLTRFRRLWVWKGAELMLVSGKYNFCNGRIENAQLREFVRYENLW